MRKKQNKIKIGNILHTIKATFKQEKKLLISLLACLGIAILIALFSIKRYVNENEVYSIISRMKTGDFSIIKFELVFLLLWIVPTLVCILTSINFYLVLLNFPIYCTIHYFLCRYVFATIYYDTLSAILTFIILIIPLICINFLTMTYLIGKIMEISRTTLCGKKIYITPISFNLKFIKDLLKKVFLFGFLPSFVYANFILILLKMFF